MTKSDPASAPKAPFDLPGHREDGESNGGIGVMITGKTTLIAHLGYPTDAFKAPMIYSPWFEMEGIDAVVMPMGVKPADYVAFLGVLFRLTNIRGALVTMPHKVTTTAVMDELTTTAKVASACNAVLLRPDGSLLGDMFDGAGFTRGVARKGRTITGSRALVVGAGGVGSAIAASLAAEGAARLSLFDATAASAEALADRLRQHYRALEVATGSNDPGGFDIVVNATPMGMSDGDPLPIDTDCLAADTFVGEVVMRQTFTPLLRRAMDKGCPVQVGTDMLFEQIPAYLEFFGFGTSTAEELRRVARLNG